MDATIFEKYETELIAFSQQLVRIKSLSGQEGEVARAIQEKMLELGYDTVTMDSMGNVVGKIGGGGKAIHFDGHMDTVAVHDTQAWLAPPFGGEIREGRLYGRGAADMKSALACAIYAGKIACEMGLLHTKTVYVSGTVDEEYCDGVSLDNAISECGLAPDCVVICEPSGNQIMLGHNGKAQIRIRTYGVSAHGAAPEQGVNAVYEMAEIISRVETLNAKLAAAGKPHGTVVLSNISCVSASLNAVPSECEIYLDRRMILGETEDAIAREMDALIAGKNAAWEVGVLTHVSWTGAEIRYEPLHTAWEISREHPLTRALEQAYQTVCGKMPGYGFWNFGTNAVTAVRRGIPCIGIGPGDFHLAHRVNECCELQQIKEACQIYTAFIDKF